MPYSSCRIVQPAAPASRISVSTRLVVFRLATIEADDLQRVLVVVGDMVDHAGLARRGCRPPPSSSALITSPVAAFTSGGPARKMVPWSRTMTVSSLMAGT